MKQSKFVKVDGNVLIEYVYDDGNNIGEPYGILVDSKNNRRAYLSSDSSALLNRKANNLFRLDRVAQNWGVVDPEEYVFLQKSDYASGFPIRHDYIKVHVPINWTFGEHIGFAIRAYVMDNSGKEVDLTNYFYIISEVDRQSQIELTSPPLLFSEKLWGKYIRVDFPSPAALSAQVVGGAPREDSQNDHLTDGIGISPTSPVFLDFSFVEAKRTINSITTYTLSSPYKTSFSPQPEYEKLALVVQQSKNGDFFEIYGTYAGTLSGFADFVKKSVSLGIRYYAKYKITVFEQGIRGKSVEITVTDNFNEKIEYRPIIKTSTTTAAIDVELSMVDAVTDSVITRRATYGMLQDEVAKYGANMMRINLEGAYTAKVYNIKNAQGAGIFASSPAQLPSQFRKTVVETVEVEKIVLADRGKVVAKSDNARYGSDIYFGNGRLKLLVQPFDNVFVLDIARAAQTPTATVRSSGIEPMDLTGMGEIKMVFKNRQTSVEVPMFSASGTTDLATGKVAFRVPATKIQDIRQIHDSGNNLFYIVATANGTTNVVYSGIFAMYDSRDNILAINTAADEAQALASMSAIIPDPEQTETGTATVVRRPVSVSVPIKPQIPYSGSSPATTKTDGTVYGITDTSVFTVDSWEWSPQQLKTALVLDTEISNLSFRGSNLYMGERLLGELKQISELLENKFLTDVESLSRYAIVRTNFRNKQRGQF